VIITFGGLAADGRWRTPKKSCLLPRKVLMQVYRRNFRRLLLKALDKGELVLPPNTTPTLVKNLSSRGQPRRSGKNAGQHGAGREDGDSRVGPSCAGRRLQRAPRGHKIFGCNRPGRRRRRARPIKYYQDRSESEDIRKAAVAALGEMESSAQDAVPVMVKVLADDESFALPGHIQMAVTRMGPAAVPDLIQLLQDEDSDVRAHAAVALNWVGPVAKDAVPALIQCLQDDAKSVRQGAAFALLRIGPAARDAAPALRKALKDEDPDVGRVAAMALKEVDADAASAEEVK
jgi:hypothetical protein